MPVAVAVTAAGAAPSAPLPAPAAPPHPFCASHIPPLRALLPPRETLGLVQQGFVFSLSHPFCASPCCLCVPLCPRVNPRLVGAGAGFVFSLCR